MKNLFKLLLILALTSCNDDDGPGDNPASPIPSGGGIVLVANEGGFNQGNASLTVFDPASGAAVQNVFSARNANAPLGDIFQSIYSSADAYFLVVNNSQKIEVINKTDYTRIQTIEGFTSPRYMQAVDPTKAYVTDLFANGVHTIDPSSGNYTGFITSNEWLERMLPVDGELWMSAPGGTKVYFMDTETDTFNGDMELSAGPNEMVMDSEGYVWVLCQGNFNAVFPQLHKIDPTAKTIAATIEFGEENGYGGRLAISPSGERIYVLIAGAVYAMGTSETEFPDTPFIAAEGRNLYGLSVSPFTGNVCVTDARDFSSNGEATIYDSEGIEIHRFAAGVIPGFVYWKE